MPSQKPGQTRESERMSDRSFRFMKLMFLLVDFLYPYIDRRIKKFGIREGMTVVDYGCGPGRYTMRFARLVGATGKVYAVDIHDMAIDAVEKKITKEDISNIERVLAEGYESGLPDHCSDVVCALDMFFSIKEPTDFLGELKRITKFDGMLVIDDGHQPRRETKRKIRESGHWQIVEETRDHLKCRPT
jgi:ubiquinone/menaquinone biosynthesis C-methylase UbiE